MGGRRLQPRDLLALSFVAHAFPVTLDHVRMAFGMSADVVRRRARFWRDARLVNVFVPDSLNSPNWLTPGPALPPLLAEKFGVAEEDVRVPEGIGNTRLDHHDGSAFLHAALLYGCAAVRREIALVEVEHERQIRTRLGSRAGSQVPDALFVFETERGQHAVAAESDTASEPVGTLRSKFRSYEAAFDAGASMLGAKSWSVAVLCPTPSRALSVARVAADVTPGLVHVGARTELSEKNVLGPSWRTLASDGVVGFRLVPSSPFRGWHA